MRGLPISQLRCLSPSLPPMVGYAATGRIHTASALMARYLYHEHMDWWEYLALHAH